jgi:hypothetical protein
VVVERRMSIAVVVAGAALLAALALPGIEIAVSGAIGAGAEQRSYEFTRTLRLGGQIRLESLAIVLSGSVAILAGLAGLGRRHTRVAAVALVVVATLALVQAFAISTQLYTGAGMRTCPAPLESCAGSVLAPPVRELQADVLAHPPGSGFELTAREGYAAAPLAGFKLVELVVCALAVLGWYACARLVTRSRLRALALVGGFVVLAVVLAAAHTVGRAMQESGAGGFDERVAPHDQRILAVVGVVAAPDAAALEAEPLVEPDGVVIGHTHL